MKSLLFWLAGAAIAVGQAPVVDYFEDNAELPPIGIVPVQELQQAEKKIQSLEKEIAQLRADSKEKTGGFLQKAREKIAALQKDLADQRAEMTRKLEEERNRFAQREQKMVARIDEMEQQRAKVTEDFQQKIAGVQADLGRKQGEFEKNLMEVEEERAKAQRELEESEVIREQNNEAWKKSVAEWRKKAEGAMRTAQMKSAQDAVANTARLAKSWQEERAQLEKQVAELSTELAKLEDSMDAKESQIGQTEQLREGLAMKSTTLATLGEEADRLAQAWREERKQSQQELAATKELFEKTNGDVKERDKRIAVLEKTLSSRNEALEQLTNEAEKLSQSWSDQRGGLQNKIDELEKKLTACQEKLEQSAKEQEEVLARSKKLEDEKQGLLSETKEIREEKEQASKKLAEQMALASDLQNKLDLAKESEGQLKTKLAELTKRQSELSNEVSRYQEEKKEDQKIIAGLRNDLKKARDQHAAAERDLAASDEKLQKAQLRIETMKEEKKGLNSELAKVREDLQKARAEADQRENATAVVKQQEQKVEALESHLARLRKAQGELEGTLLATLSDFEKLQKDYKRLQAKTDDDGQAARKAEAAQESAESQLAEIREELAEKEQKLKQARERLEEAQEAEKAAKAEAQAGKAALGKRESELSLIRQERNELQLGQQILAKEATQLREQVVSIEPVRYQLASADVVAQQQRVLAEVQEVLAVYPETKFAITGHTCNLGAKELNLRLSQERADGLQNFLLANGITEDHFKTVTGLADEQPEASNETEEGRQRNRRVEIEVLR